MRLRVCSTSSGTQKLMEILVSSSLLAIQFDMFMILKHITYEVMSEVVANGNVLFSGKAKAARTAARATAAAGKWRWHHSKDQFW